MKKLSIIVVLVLVLTTLLLPATGLCDIRIPKAAMEKALAAEDPTIVIQDYLFPYLEANPQAALLFAAELNISNGAPDTRDFGERGMFGILVDAGYVMDHYDELSPEKDRILKEAKRLLVGPWKNGGYTEFTFTFRTDVRALSYVAGKWVGSREMPIIRVEHYTEYSNKKKVAYIACDFRNLREGSYYSAGFNIVRAM